MARSKQQFAFPRVRVSIEVPCRASSLDSLEMSFESIYGGIVVTPIMQQKPSRESRNFRQVLFLCKRGKVAQ
jgi:hypothetical protein